ncbi:MAG: ATP-binding protein [Planctomycetes bacterium]|nr:ATP-binding protein [Planctomycetota bacterium]
MYDRWLAQEVERNRANPYVLILFGARQTGKSTLLKQLFPRPALLVNLVDPLDHARYALHGETFVAECQAMPRGGSRPEVVIDEVQLAPALINAVQSLYDREPGRWKFVLSGSSARRLRMAGANLLPGRAILLRLLGLTLCECPAADDAQAAPGVPSPLPFGWDSSGPPRACFPAMGLVDRLLYGQLPGLVTAPAGNRGDLLRAYAAIYLEEEVRREAAVRDLAAFARFLRLAALECGQALNYQKLSQEIGLSAPTIKSYYQILEDMFVGFRVEAFSGRARSRLVTSPRFYFFDPGVRHAAAELPLEPGTILANPGGAFEQWVAVELWKRLQYRQEGRLYYWRTRGGAEVDFVIERAGRYTPIEAKWADSPTSADARHLHSFLAEHPDRADSGYVVCRCPRPMQLSDRVLALPWWML